MKRGMKWFCLSLLTCTLVMPLLTGCSQEEKKEKSDAPALPAKDPPPEYVVAMVNDVPLTWKEMNDRAMGYMKDDIQQSHLLIPSNRMEEAKTFFRKRSISAFVMKTLILQEASKENIRPTEEDEKTSYQALVNALKGRNWTTNDFFNRGPLPPEQMHSEFDSGIIIDKYFKVKCGKGISASEEEINKVIGHIAQTNEMKRLYLDGVRKQILEGASFEDFAQKISEDKKSKGNGGVIGDLPRGSIN